MMQMNLIGRMGNFSLSVEKPLLPLFEAISNSMHAIEEAKIKDGEIVVHIHRDLIQLPLPGDAKPLQPVIGFTIEDNGVGFTDAHFNSFCTSDTVLKLAKGGKGVGRLSWLKVFQRAEISSVFLDDEGAKRRVFSFELTPEGIVQHTVEKIEAKNRRTIVKLIGFRPEYQHHCPKQFETIARKIIEHFLELFVLKSCPTVILNDDFEQSRQSLNQIFSTNLNLETKSETVDVDGHKFDVQHLRILTRSPNPDHNLHFCALKRSVETRDLTKYVSDLRGPLQQMEKGPFVYAGYVSGPSLDAVVNQERTRLDLPHETPLGMDQAEPTWERLLTTVAGRSQIFLEKYLLPIQQQKIDRIRLYIQSRPRFRPLLNLRAEWLNGIRLELSDDDLDIELYKLMHRLEIEVRQEGLQLRNERAAATDRTLEYHKSKFNKFLTESNEVGHAKLADYVIHRRAVIDFLAECLKKNEDGRFELEDVVHDVIFPMKATSNDIPDPDQSNLWMLDERLAYHFYLASDLEFRGMEDLAVKEEHERDRVDLLVLQPYDRPHAFVGENNLPFDAVTIVEFKKPMRDDYLTGQEHKDPVLQVWQYVKTLRSGKARDKNGHLLNVSPGAQFYAYIVCTLTAKMEDLAERYGFTKMADNMGYFAWQSNYQCYTEILDYQKIVQDAKKRNQVFFDKFNLPPLA